MGKKLTVLDLTCKKYLWTLQPYAYLFNTYWPHQDVTVGLYTLPREPGLGSHGLPTFPLPPNFHLHQIDTEEYEWQRWSNGMIKLLESVDDDLVVVVMDDYFLSRPVSIEAVHMLAELMHRETNILKVDLTDDRQFNGFARPAGFCGYLDLVETGADAQYNLSLQAGMWRREGFLQVLRPGLTSADFELQSPAVIPQGMRILGTKQCPVRYTHGVGTGHGACWLRGIPEEHIKTMYERGYFPSEKWAAWLAESGGG